MCWMQVRLIEPDCASIKRVKYCLQKYRVFRIPPLVWLLRSQEVKEDLLVAHISSTKGLYCFLPMVTSHPEPERRLTPTQPH